VLNSGSLLSPIVSTLLLVSHNYILDQQSKKHQNMSMATIDCVICYHPIFCFMLRLIVIWDPILGYVLGLHVNWDPISCLNAMV